MRLYFKKAGSSKPAFFAAPRSLQQNSRSGAMNKPRAFTLIELLVVIAILTLLMRS